MKRLFIATTAGTGTALGWLVTVPARVVLDSTLAFLLGTVLACLFVGTVMELLRDSRDR